MNPKIDFQITELLVKTTTDIISAIFSADRRRSPLHEIILNITGKTIAEYFSTIFKEAVALKGNLKTIKLLLTGAPALNKLTEHEYLELILLSLKSNDFGIVKFIVEEALKNFPIENTQNTKDSLLEYYKKTFKDNENIIFWCLELGCKYEIVEFLIKKNFKINNDKHQIFYLCLKNYWNDAVTINILKMFLKYIKPNVINTHTKNSFLHDILVENELWELYREDFFSLSLDRVKFLFEKRFYITEDLKDNRLLKNIFIKNVGENKSNVSKYLLEKLFTNLKLNTPSKKTAYINENNFLFNACDALNFNLIKILVEDYGACLFKKTYLHSQNGDRDECDDKNKEVLYPAAFCLFRKKLKNIEMMRENDIFALNKVCLYNSCNSGCNCDFIERENEINDDIYKCLKYLIQKDASAVNFVDKTFKRNFTLLHSVMFFLKCTNIEIIKLLATKQNIGVKTINGKTAVHLFCCYVRDAHLDILEYLTSLNEEKNVEEKDLLGNTPLHYACMIEYMGFDAGNSEIKRHLIKNGCSMDTENKQGKTPYVLFLESSVEN